MHQISVKQFSVALVRVFQRYRTNDYMCLYIKRFIVRNWLSWLWRLRSCKMGSLQDGDRVCSALWVQQPENHISWWCKFQAESLQAQVRRADVSVHVLKSWERPIFQLKQSGKMTFLLFRLFLLVSSSADEVRSNYITKGNLLNQWFQILRSSETLCEHVQDNVWQNVSASCGPRNIKLTTVSKF